MPARLVLIISLLSAASASAQALPDRPLRLSGPALLPSFTSAPALHLRGVMPRSAQDKRIAGWILVGAGTLHLALTPVCFSDVHGHGAQAACVGATAVLGTAAVVVGAVLLVQGYGSGAHAPRGGKHRGHAALEPPMLDVAFGGGRALLSYRVRF